MKGDLNTLLDFVRFTHEIRNIQRAILFEHDERYENDMEHGYQMAFVAWFLIENDKLPLNKLRCAGMAMMHDVIEVHSGDTHAHASVEERAAHEKKGKVAIEKLKKQWPSFKSMHKLIDEYERRKTPESKFVYALDKLMPIINIYLYRGRSWQLQNVTMQDMKDIKVGKIDLSPELNEYYKEFLRIVEKQPELFGKNWGEL